MSEIKGACRRATELISQGMDRPLTRRERIGLHVHLMLCRPCRVFRRQVRWLRDLVRSDAGLELPTS
ncbi:MAG: zf-HC2 domain-containing protein, partial [Planctomycetota bacterium]